MRDLEFAEQLLRGGDLVGLLVDIDMRQDQAGFGVERMQQLGCFAVGEIVEASSEHLAIKRDGALRSTDRTPSRPAASRRKACSTAFGSSPWRMQRMAVWAGARFQRRPKAAFSRRRCTVMKVSMER